MSAEAAARQKVARTGRAAEAARAELDAALARKRVQCSECERRTPVSKLVYIQTHYYIEPYSCTGGDYWRPGEGKFQCPKCGFLNRLYNRPEVVALRRYFASEKKVYDR